MALSSVSVISERVATSARTYSGGLRWRQSRKESLAGRRTGRTQSVADSRIRRRVKGDGHGPENTWPDDTAPVTDLSPSDA